MELDMSFRTEGVVTVVTVAGDVDLTSAGALHDGLDTQFQLGSRHVVVDLDGVTFLDSTGLGVLVALLRAVRADSGDARFVCSSPRILRLFAITSLDAVFEVRDTVAAAVEELSQARSGSARG